jgi:hypothetical protein
MKKMGVFRVFLPKKGFLEQFFINIDQNFLIFFCGVLRLR